MEDNRAHLIVPLSCLLMLEQCWFYSLIMIIPWFHFKERRDHVTPVAIQQNVGRRRPIGEGKDDISISNLCFF